MEVAGQAFDKLFQVCTCEGYTSSGIHCSHPLGDWRAFLVRTLQCLVCRCAGSTPPLSCLTLQPVHGTACVKALKSHLCPQLSHLIKDILASHETHIHLTLFWSGLSPSCLSPDASSCQCLSGSRTHLTWQGPRKCRQSFGNTPTPPFFLFPLLHNTERHALLLNASKFSWMLSVPESAVMFMLHATDQAFPR